MQNGLGAGYRPLGLANETSRKVSLEVHNREHTK